MGKTNQEGLGRFKNYPNGSELLLHLKCIDCHTTEKQLLAVFRMNYKSMKDIGAEYFEGDYINMMSDIVSLIMTQYRELIKQRDTSLMHTLPICMTVAVSPVKKRGDMGKGYVLGGVESVGNAEHITQQVAIVKRTKKNTNLVLSTAPTRTFTDIDQMASLTDGDTPDTIKTFIKSTIRYITNGGKPYYLVSVAIPQEAAHSTAIVSQYKWESRPIAGFAKRIFGSGYSVIKDPSMADQLIKKPHAQILDDIRPEISYSSYKFIPYSPRENGVDIANDVFNTFTGYKATLLDINEAEMNRNVDLIFDCFASLICGGPVNGSFFGVVKDYISTALSLNSGSEENRPKYDILLDWLSYNLRNPRTTAKKGILIRGGNYTVSVFLERMFHHIYGINYAKYIQLIDFMTTQRSTTTTSLRSADMDTCAAYVTGPCELPNKLCKAELTTPFVIYYGAHQPLDMCADAHVVDAHVVDFINSKFFCIEAVNKIEDVGETAMVKELTQHDWDCYYTILMHRDLSKFELTEYINDML